MSKLEKKLQIFEGTKSPRCITADNIEHYSFKKKKDKKHKKINKENMNLENNSGSFKHVKRCLSNDEEILEEIDINKSNTNESTKKRNQTSELIQRSTKKCINHEVPSTSYSQKTTEDITRVQNNIVFKEKRLLHTQIMYNLSDSEKEDLNIDSFNISTSSKLNEVTLETLHEDNLKTQAMIQQLFSSLSKAKMTLTESNDTKSVLFEEEMVEIQPGSGVKVRNRDWKLTLSRPTFTAMGLTLLTILFPHEVLLRSNLKGGPSKINRTDGNKVFTALNPRILSALIYAVEKQHPSTFKESLLGAAINNKLNVLRRNTQTRTIKTPEEEEEEI